VVRVLGGKNFNSLGPRGTLDYLGPRNADKLPEFCHLATVSQVTALPPTTQLNAKLAGMKCSGVIAHGTKALFGDDD